MEIKYKFHVALESVNNFNFINAIGKAAGSKSHLAQWLSTWERWEIINFENQASVDKVKFGDIVTFKSFEFNVFLSGNPNSNFVTTQPTLQQAERWILVNPQNPNANGIIETKDSFYLQQVDSGKRAVAAVGGQSSIPLASTQNLNQLFRLIILRQSS